MEQRSDRLAVEQAKTPVNGTEHASSLPVPPWDMYTVAVALLSGYILVPLLISNVLTLINPFMPPALILLEQQGATLLAWVGIFALLQWKYGNLWLYLGGYPPRPARRFLWETICLLFLTVAMIFGLYLLWTFLKAQFPGIQLGAEEPYASYSYMERVVLFVFAVLVAPIQEELIFRGLVQSTFHKISTPVRSVVFTCLVFLLLHGSYYSNIRALAHVLLLGLCFSIWRERTKSLAPGMIVHLINNLLASVVLFK